MEIAGVFIWSSDGIELKTFKFRIVSSFVL